MKKPIKEVMEKASKGPFELYSNGSYYEIQASFEDGHWDDEGYNPSIANFHGRDKGRANATMIMHCLNNFAPMLEALKKAYTGIEVNRDNWTPNETVAPWNPDANIQITLCAGECQAVFDAIEAASTVEVPE